MSEKILRLENITMQFGGVIAVNNMNLEVGEGEIVSLIGPNGAGKTTAFNVITGVYQPTNGAVWYRGEKIVENYPQGKMRKLYKGEHAGEYTHALAPTPDKITRMGMARTFQNIRLWKDQTVFDNVLTAMHCRATCNLLTATFHLNRQEEARQRQRVEELLAEKAPHGKICLGFTPDEEIGRGADHFDRAKFPAPVAYTVDGGELGEIEYENFNAAAAELTVRGLNIHPGEAKNKMKNAVLMANQFLSLLPPAQTPAHTEGYEGFYHVCAMEGDESLARVQLIVRDHDRKKFETRKDFLRRTADYLNTVWGAGSFELTVRDSYYNMKEKILPHMDLIENAQAAMRAADVAPRIVAIRGGTDGARLSWEGLPCPNLSTGGLNFHSIHEYIPVESLQKMTRVLVALARA